MSGTENRLCSQLVQGVVERDVQTLNLGLCIRLSLQASGVVSKMSPCPQTQAKPGMFITDVRHYAFQIARRFARAKASAATVLAFLLLPVRLLP